MVCRACGAVGDMDLHHVGPDKTEELSLMRSASDAEVEVEIKKTIPLCRSCHRALHMILARVTGSRRPLSASDTDLALRVLEYDQKMHDLGFKWCPKCRSYQADFPANSTRRDGLAGICRSCTSAYKADYRHKRKQAKERSK
jgi:Zn finger protein HypA/HybF involved in hydrogenase expression